MRLLLLVALSAVVGVAFAQTPMLKIGPGGMSVIEVVCVDAMRRLDALEQVQLERQFRSDIVVRCRATAAAGSGRVSATDFSYRNRYASDERLHSFRMSDFRGDLGEVYGSVVLDFHIGLPNYQRPWVINLYFASGSTQIVFGTNP